MDNPFEAIDRRFNHLEALVTEILKIVRSDNRAGIPGIGDIGLVQEITHLSKARLYALVAARQIPHAKRGNKLYFTREELRAWITAGKRSRNGSS